MKEKNKEVNDEVQSFESERKKRLPIYFSYQLRLAINVIICVMLCCIFAYTAYLYVEKTSDKVINYTENGKINYKVHLKDNNYYDDSDYAAENMIFVANLIDKIDIDFTYDFTIDREINTDFYYDLYAYLVIKDGTSDSIYINKKYDIEVNSKESLANITSHNVQKKASIDYGYYNVLASRFKTEYGVDTESYLRVELNVKKSSDDVTIPENSMYVDIPLSERSVNIKISPMELKNYSQTLENTIIDFNDRACLIFLLVVGLFLVFMLIHTGRLVSKLFAKKSKYQKQISRLLREYDRLIVEVAKSPIFDDRNIIKIGEFKELLDVRDNFKSPIMYYELVKNQKAYFYIFNNNDVYLYVVKNVD